MMIAPMIECAARRMGLSSSEIRSDRRFRAARVRFAIMAAASDRGGYSQTRIARALGRRDRKSVRMAIARSREIEASDPAFAQLMADLRGLA